MTDLRDRIDRFCAHQRGVLGRSPRTVDAYRRDLLQFADDQDARGEADADGADARAIRSFLARRHGDAAPATRRRKLAALRSFFDWLADHRGDDVNPARGIASPRQGRRLPTVLGAGEVEQLLERPEGGPALRPLLLSLRDRALVELLYGSGLRVSEAVGLDTGRVDLRRGEVRVLGKGDKERVVPLGEPCADAIAAWLEARPLLRPDGAQLFVNHRGGRLTARSAQRSLKARALAAGLDKDVHPHALRHSFATHLLDGGADLRAIQEMLGHASLSTTQKYTHRTVQGLLDVHRASHPRGGQDPDQDQEQESS